MKHSYLTAGMTFGHLSSFLSRNKISFDPKTLGRILFLLQSSAWSSLFASVENLRFSHLIKQRPCPTDPVFIIGHWRTGTTLLFKLLSLDKQFTAPTLFQVAEPDSLLTSHAYYKPIMKALVKETRPMDNVKIGMDEPQEDEYAIFRLTGSSPFEHLIFPNSGHYFVEEWAGKETSSKADEILKSKLKSFYSKLTYQHQGIILSKNPFHSLRISILLEAFPQARFIHMHRHPFAVVPSTVNMWEILQKENSLSGNVHKYSIEEICRVIKLMNDRIHHAADSIPSGSYTEARFEDLEKDPFGTVKKIYSDLELEFPDQQERKINEFMSVNNNFRKNCFLLPADDKMLILAELKDYMRKYSYS
ncbi:MAG: sulfotransferase [Bacteroidetes bacterium]|nr:sulfotransferase [Bacteroidota bacterium]